MELTAGHTRRSHETVDVDRCPECGIPKQTSDSHEWLNNGVIVHKGDPRLRMVYSDCEILDPLFDGIGQLIGTPVERIVVDAARRGTRYYFSPMIPTEVKDKIKSGEVSLESIISAMALTYRINGCGRLELKDVSYESKDGDFVTLICGDPYAVLLTMGDIAGSSEAVSGNEHGDNTFRRVAPGTYEMTARATGFPAKPMTRLKSVDYRLREGDIEFAKCSVCGAPREFENYRWDMDLGTIRNRYTGRRIAAIGPWVIDYIFEQMEEELGAIVPRAVIEAQCRFTRSGFHSVEEITDEKSFRDQLIFRGMGNLTEFRMDPKGLRLRLDNACMHLMVLGMVQGLFERAFEKESSIQWELSEEGDLQAEVTPLFTQFLSGS
jgi:hypothetical protein